MHTHFQTQLIVDYKAKPHVFRLPEIPGLEADALRLSAEPSLDPNLDWVPVLPSSMSSSVIVQREVCYGATSMST